MLEQLPQPGRRRGGRGNDLQLDFEVNRRAAADVQGLGRKLNSLAEHVDDLEDLVRGQLPAAPPLRSTLTKPE